MRFFCAFWAVLAVIPPVAAQTAWQLTWSDEFTGDANTAPDAAKWAYELGRGPGNDGWGNHELETYTNSPENVHLDGNGNLVIRALPSSTSGYTSARLTTKGKFTTTYGKIEARIQVPSGQGIWPAFWMLGADIDTAVWPACGEIDIMENIGREPSTVHGTVHGPGYFGANGIGGKRELTSPLTFAGGFHIFAVVWGPQSVEFFVDSSSFFRVTPASMPASGQWVFNKPFYILLNVAVGGNWPGNPDVSTQFPQDMLVDYVRVYRAVSVPAPPGSLTAIPK